MSNSLRPHGLYSSWNSADQNTGVGSHSLLQGIFPTKGSNLGLLHCRQILYQLSQYSKSHTSFRLCHYHPGPWNLVTLSVTVTDILILGLNDYPGAPTNFCIPFKLYEVMSLAIANVDTNEQVTSRFKFYFSFRFWATTRPCMFWQSHNTLGILFTTCRHLHRTCIGLCVL